MKSSKNSASVSSLIEFIPTSVDFN